MLILVVNAGSSSLKYQLINMDDESVLAKGNCDRIGIDGHISHKTADGRTLEEEYSFPTHTEAFEKLIDTLLNSEASVISSMSEISAVGHRIVQALKSLVKQHLLQTKLLTKLTSLQSLHRYIITHTHWLSEPAARFLMNQYRRL